MTSADQYWPQLTTANIILLPYNWIIVAELQPKQAQCTVYYGFVPSVFSNVFISIKIIFIQMANKHTKTFELMFLTDNLVDVCMG